MKGRSSTWSQADKYNITISLHFLHLQSTPVFKISADLNCCVSSCWYLPNFIIDMTVSFENFKIKFNHLPEGHGVRQVYKFTHQHVFFIIYVVSNSTIYLFFYFFPKKNTMKSSSQMKNLDILQFLKTRNALCTLCISQKLYKMQIVLQFLKWNTSAACHFSDSYFFVIIRQVVLTVSLLCWL